MSVEDGARLVASRCFIMGCGHTRCIAAHSKEPKQPSEFVRCEVKLLDTELALSGHGTTSRPGLTQDCVILAEDANCTLSGCFVRGIQQPNLPILAFKIFPFHMCARDAQPKLSPGKLQLVGWCCKGA